jgi:membrane-associated protease RseP (regulator of RpoE activity)
VNPDFPTASNAGPPLERGYPWYAPRRFQHRYGRHLLLFLVTFATTTIAGAFAHAGFQETAGGFDQSTLWSVGFFASGLWYSIPILLILGAHEFGHYALCRIHQVDATLPYFIPAPPVLLITGTLGAVIRIREAFPSRRALFDIGVAGPIAGFIVLLPLLYWGVTLSEVVLITPDEGVIYFGEPLLYQFAAWLHFGSIPDGYDVSIHPMAFAAWWGMLATALNLLPFGQLDGGHIVYSLFRGHRHAVMVSIATLIAAALLTTRSLSWISMLVVMVIMALVLGLRHPQVIDEDTPLDARRRLVAVFALAMFLLCFTPVPIQTFIGQ